MIKLNKLISIIILIFIWMSANGQSHIFREEINLNEQKTTLISEKIFPFLNWLSNSPKIKETLLSNSEISDFIEQKYSSLANSFNDNPFQYLEITVFTTTFKFSKTEIEKILTIIKELEVVKSETEEIMNKPEYSYWKHFNIEQFIEQTLTNELQGINKIIDRYALAKNFKYQSIDSVSYNTNSEYYKNIVNLNAQNILETVTNKTLFYTPSLNFALKLLEINKRDESIRFEPMEEGENKRAIGQISNVNWEDYPYSVLLIPGHGPEEKGVKLSPLGILRCKLAADRFYKKLAPFIILSGGYVHPFQTPFCEAIEMKKELMSRYNIPEESIIIEPHARHTTTNFRNAARLIFKYHIPHNKKALCSTTKDQSYYITNLDFDKRCIEELGYMPYRIVKRLNRNDIEFYPLVESLYIDNNDPLDP